jgi:hypothetical protein
VVGPVGHGGAFEGLGLLRAKCMTEEKASHRPEELEVLAALCLDLAEAFEERLKNEAEIRRIQ